MLVGSTPLVPVRRPGPPLLVGERQRRWFRGSRRGALPLAQRLPRGLGTWLALAFLGASVTTGAALGGHVETLREAYGEPKHALARLAGFGIDRVTVSGLNGLSEIEVLVAAGIDPKISLAFFDADAARKRLEEMPMIREAAVRKLYPGEIVINLVEREPFALWQVKGELFLIAADGTVIDRMDDGRFAYLPLVVGEGANLRARDYVALLAEAGPFAPRIRAGSLVAGRRWNLKLDTGIDIRLPEDDTKAAVTRLVGLERDFAVSEKDLIAIDLRQPDRITMRLTEEGAAARAEQLKNKTKKRRGEA
ncbi:cell division protein FtsQ/DivIB [Bosea sp. TWI1241]|uniref:cell division protein FtsQ/DivIB n=1 Tax=Bosea sp. TWI1241 TaxID=3148904 RepID=UPI003207FEB9